MSECMNQSDLEMFRHKVHNLTRRKNTGISTDLFTYWMEYGAFISIMPRQSGKTFMLEKIAQNYLNKGEKVIVLSTNSNIRKNRFNGVPKFYCKTYPSKGITHEEYNLIVDEFDFVSKSYLKDTLSHNWKSVTMASSKK